MTTTTTTPNYRGLILFLVAFALWVFAIPLLKVYLAPPLFGYNPMFQALLWGLRLAIPIHWSWGYLHSGVHYRVKLGLVFIVSLVIVGGCYLCESALDIAGYTDFMCSQSEYENGRTSYECRGMYRDKAGGLEPTYDVEHFEGINGLPFMVRTD